MAAIITGSDSGIGKATAVALARRGHDVGITYSRDEDGARRTADEVRADGRRAELRHLDLTRTADVQTTINELADALDGVEVLVNNAGTGASTPFLELELDEWRDVLEVDLTGAFLAAQAAARRMVAAGSGGRAPDHGQLGRAGRDRDADDRATRPRLVCGRRRDAAHGRRGQPARDHLSAISR